MDNMSSFVPSFNMFWRSLIVMLLLVSGGKSTSVVRSVKGDQGNMLHQDGLKNYHQLDLPGVVGPESIAFDCNGNGPYVSVSDGRILSWHGRAWSEFAVSAPNRDRKMCDSSTDPRKEPICGRPLGLKFNPVTCDLYIADAYYGLLVVGPKGGTARLLAASADGVPFRFTNALDIDSTTGLVYFTDSSLYFQRRNYLLAILSGDRSGRLMQYDPQSNKVTVLVRGLAVPNGVTLSKDNSFALVAESGMMRILKFSLTGPSKTNIPPETFAQLGRFPDNIKRNANGDFWVALNTGRGKIQRFPDNIKRNVKGNFWGALNTGKGKIQRQDDVSPPNKTSMMWWLMNDPVAAKLSEGGGVIKVLDGSRGKALESVSEVEENEGVLWIGSSMKPYVSYIKN